MDMSSVLLSLLFLRFANGRVATGFFNIASTGYLAYFYTTGQDSFTALQYGVNVIGIYFYRDGFVILSPTTNEHRMNYTIFLGGVSTLTSTIYKNFNGKSEQVAKVKHVTTARPTNYFWIGWYNDKIQVGLSNIVSKNVIMEYTDPCPFRIRYVAVSRVTHPYWWIYQGVEYQEDIKQACAVTHCDSCKRYTLRSNCPALVIKKSIQLNSEDECYSRCYKDDECEAFHFDNTARVVRGIVGLTKRKASLIRWNLTRHVLSQITSAMRARACLVQVGDQCHDEAKPAAMKRDKTFVDDLTVYITENQHMNISTGLHASHDIEDSLLKSVET
ncbi:unnamed protein product [Mytilus edulis]|uniref:Farnesoic acid O-methyl transferase domain-containing protein n=1 Tax=Mytilus edulis TaxID=6550 RepID=A0A8S3T4C7_MYTED|nr:unnamed protein product [Mytilus edulis]